MGKDFASWCIHPVRRQSLGYTVQGEDVVLRSHQILPHLTRYEMGETAHGRLLNGRVTGRYHCNLLLPGLIFLPDGELGMTCTVSNTHMTG